MIALGRRGLATIAGTLGTLALLAGSPPPPPPGGLDVAALARAIAREEDHVTALELAAWIRDGKRGLRVIDVRAPEDADPDDGASIPGAERLSLESLVATPFARDETVVVFSQGGAHAAQAWVLLTASGRASVFFLRDGLDAWQNDVLHPTLARSATPEDAAAFARIAALSRFFGGAPRTGAEVSRPAIPSDAPHPSQGALHSRRRGC